MHGMEKFMSRLREKCPGRHHRVCMEQYRENRKSPHSRAEKCNRHSSATDTGGRNAIFPCREEELRILKPDVVLFLTGPSYDLSLSSAFKALRSRP